MNTNVYGETFHWMGKDITFGDAADRLEQEYDYTGTDPISDIIFESLLNAMEGELGIRPHGSLETHYDEVLAALYRKDLREVRDEVLDTEVSIDEDQSITWRELFQRIRVIACWTAPVCGIPAWEVLDGAAEQLGLEEKARRTPSRALMYRIIEKLQERQQEEEAE